MNLTSKLLSTSNVSLVSVNVFPDKKNKKRKFGAEHLERPVKGFYLYSHYSNMLSQLSFKIMFQRSI